MPRAGEYGENRRNNAKVLVAATPGQAKGRRREREEGKGISKVLTVEIFAELWILSTLADADMPLWGRAILERIQAATRIVEGDIEVYPGYMLSHAHVFGAKGFLAKYEAAGYIEQGQLPQEQMPHHGGLASPKAYVITAEGREYLAKLREEYRAEVAGALRTMQVLVNQVYDADVLTTPLTRLPKYTTRQGDPNKII